MRLANCKHLLNYLAASGGLIYLLTLSANGAALLPDGAGPVTNRVVQLPARPTFSWVGWGTNLLVNGDFETGDFTGWNREVPAGKELRVRNLPVGGDTSPSIFAGKHSVGFIGNLPGPVTLSQVVTLPVDATGAVLSWVDQVQNDFRQFAPPDHTFRVEAQTPDGFPLAVVYELVPGDGWRTPWSRRSVSLGAFAGQTVRIAFVESDTLGPQIVNLDDIRLETGAPANTTFEVRLSQSALPTAADVLGHTDVPSISMPALEPNTPYRWQVVVTDAEGTREGPVWSFLTGTNGPATQLLWELPDGPVRTFQPLLVGLQARDPAGFPVPAYTNTTLLASISVDSRPASLVITEVNPGLGVEFLNGTSESLAISGWEVSLYDSTTWPKPRTTFVFPLGANVAAGKNLVLRRGGTAPGGGVAYFTGQPIDWSRNNSNRVIAVLLRNSVGEIVDFFAADQAFPALIAEPVAVPLSEWIGRPAPRVGTTSDSYQRLGSRDRQLGIDWLVCVDSFGRLNPYGGPLFLPGVAIQELIPNKTGTFREGRWTGSVESGSAGSGLLFLADDRQGRSGWSQRLDVSPSPLIVLELPPNLNEGESALATLRLPSALPTNLVVQVESSWPARLAVPAAVTFPAGITQVQVPLTVSEDDGLQGIQSVTVNLRAPGFGLTRESLFVADNEFTQLGLDLPDQIVEGGPDGIGILTVAKAPEAAVRVDLTASVAGQLVLPGSVLVPAGQNRVTFPVRAVNDGFIDGDVSVDVVARAGNWTEGTDSVRAVDNEDRQLRLLIPPRIRGQAPTNGQVRLSGMLTADLEIQLDPVEVGILSVPAQVRIPAGSTNVIFDLQGSPDMPFRGASLVSLSASSPGFQSTTVFCEVWDETDRQLNLAVTDLVFHPGWDRLLAVVAARDPAHPNELIVVNPYTGEIERTLPVATDPTAVALSDDGKILWVGSYGESSVQRIDLATFSVSGSFSLEEHWPVQLIARRGRNDSVIVYRYKTNADNEVALYTDGVRQSEVINPGNLLFMSVARGDADQLFVSIPSVISGVQPQLNEYRVTDTGLSHERAGPEDSWATWVWADGRLYSTLGRVRDAATFDALPGIAGLNHSVLTVEPQRDQGFFLTSWAGELYLTRASLSLGTVAESVTFPFLNSEFGVTRPVRWGEHGLAFRADDTLHLYESAYVDPGPSTDLQISSSLPVDLKLDQEFDWILSVTNAGPVAATGIRLEGALPAGVWFVRADVPGGTGTSIWGGWNATLPPLPAGATSTVRVRLRSTVAGPHSLSVLASLLQRDSAPANNVATGRAVVQLDLGPDAWQSIELSAADLCFDPGKNALWATVPDVTPDGRNDRLVRLNPDTGLIEAEFPSGRLPGRLVRTDDGRALYVALDGESLIQRFDLLSETWGAKLALFDFSTNDFPARNSVTDLVVLPGETERVVAVWSLPEMEFSSLRYFRTVAFREGARLPGEVRAGPELERGTESGEVVTFTGGFGGTYTFARHRVDDTGLTTLESRDGALIGLDIQVVGSELYSNSGQVMKLPELSLDRDFGILASGPVLALPDLNRVLFLNDGGFATAMLLALKVFDANSGRLIEEVLFGGEYPVARPLIHCGGDRIALRAFDNSAAPNRVVILRTSAIPAATTPADLQVRLDLTTPISWFFQDTEFRLTVTNAGPGLAERVHYSIAWVGSAQSLQASRGTVTHDYFTGVRGFVEQLPAGESVEVVFRTRPGDAGRFPVTAATYSAAPDPVSINDVATGYQVVAWPPSLGQNTLLHLANSDLVSDPAGRRLFASTPEGVVLIDPAAGQIEPYSRFGPGPGALAVSADGLSLWVAFDHERSLRRFRLVDGQLLQSVESLPGDQPVRHLAAHPFDPAVAVFSLGNKVMATTAAGLTVVHALASTQEIGAVNFAPDGTVLVARSSYDDFQLHYPIDRLSLSGSPLATSPRDGLTTTLRVARGKVFLDEGLVNDGLSLEVRPGLEAAGSPAPISASQRVAYLQSSFNGLFLHLADMEGIVPVQSTLVGGTLGSVVPSSVVAWGADGMAFRSELAVMLVRLGELPVPIDRDFDGDGLSDIWEWHNNLNPNLAADAWEDPDQDGVNTLDEFISGTDHTRADSVLKLLGASAVGDALRFRFAGVLGRRYQVEMARPLGSGWQPVGSPVEGADSPVDQEVAVPAGTEAALFRVRVLTN